MMRFAKVQSNAFDLSSPDEIAMQNDRRKGSDGDVQ
jgi:hypothetical protein